MKKEIHMINCSIVNQFKNVIYYKRRAVKEILCMTGKSYPQSCRLLYQSPETQEGILLYEVLIKWAPQYRSMMQIFCHSWWMPTANE